MNTRFIITTLLLTLLLPVGAFASVITPDNYSSVTGVDILFGGGNAAVKTVDGYQSLGLTGGVDGEISIGQSITFNFNSSQNVESLNFVALFNDGSYNDVGGEVAQVTGFSGNQSFTYTLTVTSDTTALWSGSGAVSSPEATPGLEGNGGVWTVTNPFAELPIDSIVFTALDNGAGGTGGQNSDFGVGGVTTSNTPIPAAAWLLGSGLLGLIGIRRKQN